MIFRECSKGPVALLALAGRLTAKGTLAADIGLLALALLGKWESSRIERTR